MSATKFCAICGEKINANRKRFPGFTICCPRCQKRSPLQDYAPLALLCFCLLTGFFIGRLTTTRQPFNFIGTPIDLQIARNALANESRESSADNNKAKFTAQANPREPNQSGEDETLKLCGAPTKSGRPCRRKVRGGGYCYQHKDKFNAKSATAQPSSDDKTHAPE